ncbi:N-acetylmuramoyl-L-alanine amidase [Streptomyces sp. NBC_01358]|uniref:N-acetylmuramoyl-L-alanine amidase n=1 Tax=Streptomyces sp. NBC_01358 TaxID=2903837 RepID=UPI002E2FFFE4|nr:N-acetylmuramoyl-L-alanine amidase [Streptomyces sp. NBC_01358]
MKPSTPVPRLRHLVVATAVVLSCVALSNDRVAVASASAARARTGIVHTVTVPGSGQSHRALAPRTTAPFRMLGVTWSDPAAVLGGSAQVRTRDSETRTWSDWRTLELDVHTPESGADHGATGVRGGTQPLWVGPSDGVQARITGTRLPDGLRVDLVDPDGGTPRAGTANTAAAATATAAGVPAITSRAEWGADESLVDDPPTYTTDTKAVFVHHTAGTNDYTCAESASVIRGILTYHVKSNGWNDIGYNFFVDKCGTLFEGRAGGIDRPVYGAHTYGFNTDTSGVAVLGDFNTASTTPAVRDALARLAAWKLGLYGINPAGTIVMAAGADNGKFTLGQKVTMNRISGHRDGFPTECPGTNLYGDLPAIRTAAAAVNSRSAHGDTNGDGHADLTVGVPRATANGHAGSGQVSVVPGTRTTPYAANRSVLTQETEGVPGGSEDGDGFGAASAFGDLDHDGYQDLVVSSPGEEVTAGASDEGGVSVLRGGPNGLTGQAGMINEPAGTRSSNARFGAALTTGHFDGDGGDDILAVSPGAGRAWTVDGSSRAFSAPLALADGPVQDTAVTTGDFDHDGFDDAALTFRTPDGDQPLVVARGSAGGLLTDTVTVLDGAGGRALAAGDVNGDGYADLSVGRPTASGSGQIITYPGSSAGLETAEAAVIDTGDLDPSGAASEAGTSLALGDADGDGYADVLAGAPGGAGRAYLLHGSAEGLTATGAVTFVQGSGGVPGAAEAGDRFGSAVTLTDLNGDGTADAAFGAEGENAGDGTVMTLTGGVGASYGPSALSTGAGQGIGSVLTD